MERGRSEDVKALTKRAQAREEELNTFITDLEEQHGESDNCSEVYINGEQGSDRNWNYTHMIPCNIKQCHHIPFIEICPEPGKSTLLAKTIYLKQSMDNTYIKIHQTKQERHRLA